MTDEQTNRVIAESLEPKPAWNHPAVMTLAEEDDIIEIVSDGGCWSTEFVDKVSHGVHKPANFLTDPAMRDLLQAKLLEEGWVILMMYLNPDKLVHLEISNSAEGDNSLSFADSRERIWALAYMKAHGLEP